MWYTLVMFHLSEHVGLSLVRNGEGGGALLPGLPIHLHWNTLVNYDLRRERVYYVKVFGSAKEGVGVLAFQFPF